MHACMYMYIANLVLCIVLLLLLSILPVRHRRVSQEGKACRMCHPKPIGIKQGIKFLNQRKKIVASYI